jgi:hypothetical protein
MPIFDTASLKKAVETELGQIPKDKKGALCATVGLSGEVEFRIATRIGDTWQLGAVIHREKADSWKEGWSGGVHVKATW